MDLERLAVTLRPRRPWEGLDLGFTMGRQWFPTLWILWWITALPVTLMCLLLAMFLPGNGPLLWVLVIWWCKPVFDAPLLYWVSRTLFGERLSLRQTRSILRGALPWRMLTFLLWRRLSPRRSFIMPVILLEGLRGRTFRERLRALSANDGAAIWLSVLCYNFEVILWLGMLFGLYALIPENIPRFSLLEALTGADSASEWFSSLLYICSLSFLAPFYVCAGFSHYLSRRTIREAWDLELAFRRAHEHPARPSRPRTPIRQAAALALALTGAVLAFTPGEPALAYTLPDQAQTRQMVNEVFADPDFGTEREIRYWKPIQHDKKADDKPEMDWNKPTPPWVIHIGTGLKWALAALGAFGVALLVIHILRTWNPSTPFRKRQPRRPEPTLPRFLDPDGDSAPLPPDLTGAIEERLAQGDSRGALSLLYRASLERLVETGVTLPAGATEGECLGLARRHLPKGQLGPLPELTHCWQALAYAHREPGADHIRQLVSRWSAWQPGERTNPAGAPA